MDSNHQISKISNFLLFLITRAEELFLKCECGHVMSLLTTLIAPPFNLKRKFKILVSLCPVLLAFHVLWMSHILSDCWAFTNIDLSAASNLTLWKTESPVHILCLSLDKKPSLIPA